MKTLWSERAQNTLKSLQHMMELIESFQHTFNQIVSLKFDSVDKVKTSIKADKNDRTRMRRQTFLHDV